MSISKHEGWGKFKAVDDKYFAYIDELMSWNVPAKDLIFQFPAYVGYVNLARFLFFYDLYKKTISLNGHVADVGTWKGASFLFMAKMIKLFEPYNTTQVYAFDWFQGMEPGKEDDQAQLGNYCAEYESLKKLIELQGLDDVAIINKMDVTSELIPYFEERPWMRFKFVFIDCGIEGVLESSLANFWPRLVNGGVLILDHYNSEVSPTESRILEKYIGNLPIQQAPFNRQPTCYVIKSTSPEVLDHMK
ncbi:MAG: hypothetical protein B7Y56_12565 [Gallionellales bacterium 35-53-114]|jgi:hypothetical protein|nr:MAG: hypothetical protein B7Y56_12565 [Gallionellales bacterium 35-53-114]OYZ63436.1 MAG: hypothetical protein B7Y04_08775 [Gallionellales bacterium 24-53-125]OZB10951.1 MAG: hypothetical protein B7X61_00915 [Gallionellales bacterium 39-52-133]HQS58865.1 class I SAM-dependent methyltransferase [Gallionellaceae bacterium]HQS75750.1 class I SAM-dependent methyltransferase [Gallionellaceae bacterium]